MNLNIFTNQLTDNYKFQFIGDANTHKYRIYNKAGTHQLVVLPPGDWDRFTTETNYLDIYDDLNITNLNKLRSVNCKAFAILSAVKKKPANIINRLF